MCPLIIVHGQPHLLQVIFTLRPAGRLPSLLNSRQQQGNQHRNNRDDNQQFNQGKSSACGHGDYRSIWDEAGKPVASITGFMVSMKTWGESGTENVNPVP